MEEGFDGEGVRPSSLEEASLERGMGGAARQETGCPVKSRF